MCGLEEGTRQMCFGRGHPLRTLENRQRSEADERERGTRGRTRCFSFIPLPRVYQRISLFPDKMAQACFICVGGYRSNSHDGATKLPGGSGAVSSKQQALLPHLSNTHSTAYRPRIMLGWDVGMAPAMSTLKCSIFFIPRLRRPTPGRIHPVCMPHALFLQGFFQARTRLPFPSLLFCS